MRKYEKLETNMDLFNEELVRKNANDNEDIVLFVKRLCMCLDEKGKNASDLVRGTKISKSSISGYIIGKQKPSIIQIKKIANFFGVSSDYLLGLSNVKSTNEDVKTVHKLTGLSDEAIIELKKQYKMAIETDYEHIYPMFKRGISAINYLIANEEKYNLFKSLANFIWFETNNKELLVEQRKVVDDNTSLEYSFDMMIDIAKIRIDRTLYKIKEDIDTKKK